MRVIQTRLGYVTFHGGIAMDWEQEYADFVMQQEQEERGEDDAPDALWWWERQSVNEHQENSNDR